MKITNWRRKLIASLVAGGMMGPAAALGANLDTNLVVNPGFEDVDTGVTCCFGAVQFNGWADGTQRGFAYNYNQNYDNGGPLAGGGTYYFTPNGNVSGTPDVTAPGQVAQNISVSTGPTGSLIPTGEAAVKLSGFFSSYLTNNDFGTLHVQFLNASGGSLGSVQVSDRNVATWTQETAVGIVPVGTATLRVSVFGTPLSGGPDGYIDNVDVRITQAANELMFLEVNTTTGHVAVKNQTGDPVHIDYYEITSATGRLNATAWNSLQEQNIAGFPAGNGSGNGWEEFGGSRSTVIGESYLTGNSGVAHNGAVGLGAAFTPGGAQDLVFRYGVVAGGTAAPEGDYNGDGKVDAADYVLWRKTNINGQQGYNTWRANFGATDGPSGTSTLVTGFVRYVTAGAGAGAAAVPEPSTVILLGMGFVILAAGRKRFEQ